MRRFAQLDRPGPPENFITVLFHLGRSYVQQRQLDYGRGCYEWALLLAMAGGLLERTYPPQQLGTPPLPSPGEGLDGQTAVSSSQVS